MINFLLLIIQHALLHLSSCLALYPCHPFIVTSSDFKSGNISSPNYPNPYPPDADCTYLLQGSDWQGIKIIFHDFDLEPPYTAGCLSDYIDLDIYDVRDRMTFHRRFCGSSLPAPLLVLHPKAKLVFRTNHAVHHRGFHASFEFVDEGEVMTPKLNGTQQCGQHITAGGGGGVIQFPGRSKERSMPLFGIDCIWLLRVDYTHRIYIRVQDLEFQGSIENCQKAQLGIYDGYEHSLDESTVLKKFCGDQLHYKVEDDRAILSTRNRILVRFQTHTTTDSTKDVALLDKNIGFRIVWSEVSSEETTDDCTKNKRFACQETRACISKDHLGAFSVCPELIYCISQDLVCDGVSHCAETDASDEKNCFTRSLNALIIGGPASLLVILLLTFCTIVVKRKKLLKQVRMSFLCWRDERRKKKSINGYVLDNPIHSPFIGLARINRSIQNNGQQDNSSVESASICPLSDSESSDVSICPFHGTKYMNHLPVVHEAYNLDSDDSSPLSPNDPLSGRGGGGGGGGQGSNSLPPSPPPAPTSRHPHHPHHHSEDQHAHQQQQQPQLHSWRLKSRPMKRTNAVCLSDEYKSSSGEDEPPCICGAGISKTMNLTAMMLSSTSQQQNNDKIEDSGIELLDSFDLHSNHANETVLTHHITTTAAAHMYSNPNSKQQGSNKRKQDSAGEGEGVSSSGFGSGPGPGPGPGSGSGSGSGSGPGPGWRGGLGLGSGRSVHRGVQTEEEVLVEEVVICSTGARENCCVMVDNDEGPAVGAGSGPGPGPGNHCLSARSTRKVTVKVREVGTNTGSLPNTNTSANANTNTILSSHPHSTTQFGQTPGGQSHSHGQDVQQVKVYKPLCSTVTTFGVYPESTSTDV